jgi:uncharacterized membrane protein YgcG
MHPIQQPSFQSDFFQFYAPPSAANPAREPPAPRADDAASRIFYRPEIHGTHENFCLGEDFDRYREQVFERVTDLAAFCQLHDMPDAERIREHLEIFLGNRFEHENYYGAYVAAIDSEGKQSLDKFCDMIGNDALPLEKRKNAIRNLSDRLTMCADGAVSNLLRAERDLALSIGGLRSKLWQIKEDIVLATLQTHLARECGHINTYRGDEVHYVNAAWNHVAPRYGLAVIADKMSPVLGKNLLSRLANEVDRALTPDKVALHLAEELLEKFKDLLPDGPQEYSGNIARGIPSDFCETLDTVNRELGLAPSTVRFLSFVACDDDGGGAAWQTAPTLIAVDLLGAMHAEDLLTDIPEKLVEWREEGGVRAGLFTYGDSIRWVAKAGTGVLAEPGWSAALQTELPTEESLRKWEESRCPDVFMATPLSVSLRAAAKAAAPVRIPSTLAAVPAVDLEPLKSMPPDLVDGYLREHLAGFIALPVEKRPALVDRILGAGPAAREVIAAWYPRPLLLMAERPDNGMTGKTRLERWMETNDAGAIDAVGVFLNGNRLVQIAPLLPADELCLALGFSDKQEMLCQAIEAGNEASIKAWHRLLSNPTMRNRVGLYGDAPLKIVPSVGAALLRALKANHVGAIGAVQALFADRDVSTLHLQSLFSVSRHIARNPQSRLVFDPCHTASLWDALGEANETSIVAFRSMLADQEVLPYIAQSFAEMLVGNDTGPGGTGLNAALHKGNGAAIRGLRLLLSDPDIGRSQRYALTDILHLRWRMQQPPGLWHAFGNERCLEVMDEYRALLTCPEIYPNVQHVFAAMLKPRPGSQGGLRETFLTHAMERGGAKAVHACRLLLCDSMIVPFVRRTLPDLLAGTGVISPLGSEEDAMEPPPDNSSRADTILAMQLMLTDPRILPLIESGLSKILAVEYWDRNLFSLALAHGEADYIREVHSLLTNESIIGHVAPDIERFFAPEVLAELLERMHMPGTPAGSAKALREFLNDPAIFPHIWESLPPDWQTALSVDSHAISLPAAQDLNRHGLSGVRADDGGASRGGSVGGDGRGGGIRGIGGSDGSDGAGAEIGNGNGDGNSRRAGPLQGLKRWFGRIFTRK